MADKIDKSLNKAIDEVLKDYNKVLKKAVEYASDTAVEDIYQKSMNCLEEYYDNYDQRRYNRTDNLWRSIVPYLQIKEGKKSIKSTVGVKYDASLLDMYAGSKQYDPTDGDWIIENYLNGIHPGTNGGRTTETAWYNPALFGQVDDVSPTQKMKEYLNGYYQIFDNNIFMYFISEVGKKI